MAQVAPGAMTRARKITAPLSSLLFDRIAGLIPLRRSGPVVTSRRTNPSICRAQRELATRIARG
eukprot:CAMPEP_0172618614 /NCGR_PEP_ID=MMETSP1068-20121228/83203_1 /TAXON_ID=35684 /ORGANISM="Pseudopedinella elastica, Strain CCMP716" /LENGTH=63 /DNA_ID=CAMNT_0013424947 /DNA_START=164 /DNA_END=355 /DNA_ORIENTATION=-